MRRKYTHPALCLLLCLFGAAGLLAQRSISGKIISAADGTGLPGVSIAVVGTSSGTITDADGNYSLSNIPNDATLAFSMIGFATQNIVLGASNVINVELVEDALTLGEVTITGAFGIKREARGLTYSAQKVGATELLQANDPNLVGALQGKIAGALINTSSGAPGAGVNIVLRGINSLDPSGDNQPLIVVDGVVMSNATNVGGVLPSAGSNAFTASEQFSNTNRLADINPNDIAEITVLKGPAATALYGSLAQNGALVITTKKGADGKSTVQFSSSYGTDEINKWPDIQTQYREGISGRIRINADNTVNATKFQDYGPPLRDNPAYNNFRNIFVNGRRIQNNLSITGGNKGFNYLLSGGMFTQDGIVPKTGFDRYTGRLNAGYNVNDWLILSGGVAYTNSNSKTTNGGDKSVLSAISYHSNTYDVNDYINPNGSIRSYAGTIIDNPRWLAEFAPYRSKVDRYSSQISADAKVNSWLSFRYQVGLDQYTDVRKFEMPNGTDVGSQVGGFLSNENFSSRILTSNLLATIQKDLGQNLKLRFLAGNSVIDNRFEYAGVRGEGLVIPGFYDISNVRNVFPSYDFSQSRLVGVFGDLNLDYKGFAYFSASARNDWTSTLPAGNNSFFYPSVGAGFVFSEIPGLKMPSFLSYGKIRASYAETGKGTSPYRVGSYFESSARFPFGPLRNPQDPTSVDPTPGFRQRTIVGVPNLRPERTQGLEYGVEMMFLKRRFGFDLTYFDQKTIDQIFPVPVSNASGYSAVVTNAGTIRNKGVELSVNIVPLKSKNFNWDMRINFAQLRGTVESVDTSVGTVTVFDGAWVASRMVKGGRVGDLYGYRFNYTSGGQLLIGADGYPIVDQSKLVLVGNAIPDFTAALINTFSYKNLSINFQFEWRKGGDVYDMGLRNSIRNGNIQQTERRHEQVIFRGVKADGTPNNTPVEVDGDNFYRNTARYNSASEILLQDASWLRLRVVSVGFSLPKATLQSLPFSNLTLTLTGNNLFLNTPYAGFDPESLQNGAGSNAFGFSGLTTPAVKSLNLGVNVTFK
jgi:TonB-linked SusC/RagA family outer membrane protein